MRLPRRLAAWTKEALAPTQKRQKSDLLGGVLMWLVTFTQLDA
jgi:hypothetical protein